MNRLAHAGLALLLLTAMPAQADETPSDQTEKIPLARVADRQLKATLAASGSVQARRVTEIGSEVSGRIVRVLVDVGDSVEEGAELFLIDPEPYRMALAEAKAGLALAKAQSSNADAEVARIQKLIEQNAASQQRVDKLRTEAEVARARVAQGQAALDRARRDLARTRVEAPYAASVVERRAHEGSMSSGAPVLVLQERGALEFVVNVPEASPAPVRPGDPVELIIEGLPDPIATTVSRVNARVNSESRTYQVRGEVPDPTGTVKAGSYLRAELGVQRSEARPTVRSSALVTRDGRTYVMRVENDIVHRTSVRVGIRDGRYAEILAGLETGDLVVHGPTAGRLADGTRIRVKEPIQAARKDLP